MSPESSVIIPLAVAKGFISQSQADLLNEELFMFPGGNVLAIMLRRAMVTPEQARKLEELASSPRNDMEDFDGDFDSSESLNDLLDSNRDSTPSAQRPLFNPPPIEHSPVQPSPPPAVPAPRPSLAEAIQQSIQAVSQPKVDTRVKVSVSESDGNMPDPALLRYLKAGRERGCSDLHLTPGKAPYLRKNGRIFFLDEPVLTAEVSRRLNRSVLTKVQQLHFDEHQQLDFAFNGGVVGRFRANVYQQRLGMEGAFRFIPNEIPTLSSLGLPSVLEKLTTYTQGLNLVTGPGGCGKTSTVAAMLEHINRHRHEHIITVEDPVEYVFSPLSCQITQREVGSHTESFASALRTALRQDPDVIMIGELRDLETTSISITAAETGHLVFGTLHTASAMRTVARVLDVFPPSQRAQICLMVAESLRGIMSQQLIERKDGNGRICAMEILMVTTGVSQVIKEGKTHQLVSHMQSGRKLGMISMDDALMELLKKGMISGREAYARAENKNEFEPTKWQA